MIFKPYRREYIKQTAGMSESRKNNCSKGMALRRANISMSGRNLCTMGSIMQGDTMSEIEDEPEGPKREEQVESKFPDYDRRGK